jgi:hypothetical protein
MLTILPATDAALVAAAKYEYWAEMYDTAGVLVMALDIVEASGSKTAAWGAPIRDTIDFTVASLEDIVPETVWTGTDRLYGDDDYGDGDYGDERREWLRGLFLPLLTTVKIWEKVTYAAGDETILLGTFTLDDPAFQEDNDGTVSVRCSGWDLAGNLTMDRFAAPFIATGLNVGTAIEDLLAIYAPTMTVTLPTTAETCGKIVYLPGCGKSPWEAARELAELVQWNIWVDRDGGVQGAVIPAPGAWPAAVYTFDDTINLYSLSLVPSAKNLCNRVIVYGANSAGTPVKGVAEDTSSPYSFSALGRWVTREQKSEKPTTIARAEALANALLRRWGRLTERVAGECAPIPHLEVGDVVTIKSERLNMTKDFMIESITIPLDASQRCSFTAVRTL